MNGDDAPEVDPHSQAPEIYHKRETSWVDRDSQAPQNIFVNEGLQPYVVDRTPPYPGHTSIVHQKKPFKTRLVLILVAAIACLAALSIGLGVGLTRHDSSSVPSATSTSPASTSEPAIPSSSTPVAFKHGVLNDTSLAVVTTVDENRHIFFQDFNGSIRHTVFAQSAGSWVDSVDYVTTPSIPRNHTPLAAITSQGSIQVFYISSNGSLAAAPYIYGSSYNPELGSMNGSLLAAADTRTLSVALLPPDGDSASDTAILLYEAPNGNITVLNGSFIEDGWSWQNISEAIYASLQGADVWLTPPASSIYAGISGTVPNGESVRLALFNSDAIYNGTACPLYIALIDDWRAPNNPKNLLDSIYPAPAPQINQQTVPNSATSAIQNSDVTLYTWSTPSIGYGFAGPAYVQNQTLIFNFNGGSGKPNPTTPYPFTRLAWTNSSTAGAVYVYHQLDEGVIAEDAFYVTANWISKNVSVGVSN